MRNKKKMMAITFAILAAMFYAINMPMSKLLLVEIGPALMASFLYFGAGIGIGIMYLLGKKKFVNKDANLSKKDLPFVIGMILLDIAAPILLMIGLLKATSSNAALLNNFEIVATSLIALLVFKEIVSGKLWFAILLITISSALLSFEDISSLKFSIGSILVLAAAICWGFENNFTRKISSKNTYQIVILKGIFSGLGSMIVALIIGESLPQIKFIAYALGLGFVAYGLSIFLYVRAQNILGAAKTSAFYAIAPFAGAMLSFLILKETLTINYIVALLIMFAGSGLVIFDTLGTNHTHVHTHSFVHTHTCDIKDHEGDAKDHIPGLQSRSHSHSHNHYFFDKNHFHRH